MTEINRTVHHYRCGHCQYPLSTSFTHSAVTLPCQECGAVNTFHFSASPESCELPLGHQCSHANYTQDTPLLAELEAGYLAFVERSVMRRQDLRNSLGTRR